MLGHNFFFSKEKQDEMVLLFTESTGSQLMQIKSIQYSGVLSRQNDATLPSKCKVYACYNLHLKNIA